MKRLLAAAIMIAGLIAISLPAGAATNIANWSTGTYQLVGGAQTASGIDSAIVHLQTMPVVMITKWVYNIRTNDTQPFSVNAVAGDVIQFTINWAVIGEATADTIVINDYVPFAMTVVGGSNSDTEVNCSGASSIVGGRVSWTNADFTNVAGTDPGPAANGVMKFRVTVN